MVRRPRWTIIASSVLAAIVLVGVVVAVVVFRSRGSGPGATSSHGTSSFAGPRDTEIYASDGKTLLARLDGDPNEKCLNTSPNDWGFFCDYLLRWWQQQQAFGAQPAERLQNLRNNGFTIVTTLDPALQASAKASIDRNLAADNATSLSVVTVEPGSGRVTAMATNRTFSQNLQANGSRTVNPNGTTSSPVPNRYPNTTDPIFSGDEQTPGVMGGASFMMFTIVAALEQGIPLSHIVDTKVSYPSKYIIDSSSPAVCPGTHFWCVTNGGDEARTSGQKTMVDAFTHALSTYFVPLEESVGADKAVGMAQRLGVTFHSAADAAYAASPKQAAQWGAFTLGASAVAPLDLANAYATLAADGRYCSPLPVKSVVDRRGRAVPNAADPRCVSVLSADVARAAVEAGRCAVGDRPALSAPCTTAPASGVRAAVGHPISGQLGFVEGKAATMVMTSPQLAVAALAGRSGLPLVDAGITQHGRSWVIDVASQALHDALGSLPNRDFPAPSRQLALGG
jgi:membrane peptidoglycan carboxypeptidase